MNKFFTASLSPMASPLILAAVVLMTLLGCAIELPTQNSSVASTNEAAPAQTEADPTMVALFQVESTPMASPAPSGTSAPQPTLASVFNSESAVLDIEIEADAALTDTALADLQSNISSIVGLEAEAAGAAQTLRGSNAYAEQLIYDDVVDSNWTLTNSFLIDYDALDTSHWFEPLVESPTSETETQLELESDALSVGAVAIEVTPTEDYGALFFAVQPEATTSYPLDNVLGVSFWLNSGPQLLDTADLAITMLGSNDLPYWAKGDDSVFGELGESPNEETFSETRLYFLDINRSIPPDTWTRVYIWLDELDYQPDFDYITGFYIKNDQNFRGTFYVDQVSLLVLPDEDAQ